YWRTARDFTKCWACLSVPWKDVPMKPSRIVSSSSSPKAPYLSYHPRQKGNGSSWHDGAALLVVGPARNLVRHRIFPVHGGHLPTLSEGVRASTRCSAHAARRLLAASAAGTSARRFEGPWRTQGGTRRRGKVTIPVVPGAGDLRDSGRRPGEGAAARGTHHPAQVPRRDRRSRARRRASYRTHVGGGQAQSRQHRRYRQRAVLRRLLRRVGALRKREERHRRRTARVPDVSTLRPQERTEPPVHELRCLERASSIAFHPGHHPQQHPDARHLGAV